MLKRNKLNKTTKEYNLTTDTKKGLATMTAYSLEDGFFTYSIQINNEVVYQDVSACWRLRELNDMIECLGMDWLINQTS